jgi:predicted RNase H-like HicB family nuclease
MITRRVEQALARARYDPLEVGSWCAAVPRLRGVIAAGSTLEASRSELAEVVEAWILVRVSRGLPIPRLGRVAIQVRRAR